MALWQRFCQIKAKSLEVVLLNRMAFAQMHTTAPSMTPVGKDFLRLLDLSSDSPVLWQHFLIPSGGFF